MHVLLPPCSLLSLMSCSADHTNQPPAKGDVDSSDKPAAQLAQHGPSLPSDYQAFIHISRYARFNEAKHRRETWPETVSR